MIDNKFLRENPETVKENIRKKFPNFAVDVRGKRIGSCLISRKETDRKQTLHKLKSEKSSPKMENFLYQRERKVSQNLMLKANQAIIYSPIFASVFGAKKRFSQ